MIEINNLDFQYADDEEKVFSSFSLSVKNGEIVLVMGPCGSGKTTLAKIITGAVPKYSGGTLSGEIIVDGKNILDLDISERMTLAGRVAQNTDEMMLFSTVEAELSFPLENLGLDKDEIKSRIDSALDTFGLEGYRDVSTSELSGGEKRRLMCAILFAVDPSLYILDESFDELSPYWRRRLGSLLKERGKSVIIFGSHDLSAYSGLFDRIVAIKDKRAAEYCRENLPRLSFSSNKTSGELKVESLKLKRAHRSILDVDPFSLDIDSFSLKKGSVEVLMGENGSGKSTLSKALCGLLKPDSANIYIDGKKTSDRERRVRVAYLMQNPFEQLFLPTVQAELESTGEGKNEIAKALAMFKLDPSWYISELSYGRAKLVQAAIFYLLDRDYVILDELDSAIGYDDSINVLQSFLNKGAGVLVITHDERFASLICERRITIDRGRICR